MTSDSTADAVAEVFTGAATAVLTDNAFLGSRDEIRDFVAAGFAAGFKGGRVTSDPVNAHFATPDAVVPVTSGGVLAPGESAVATRRAIPATWVLNRQDRPWLLTSYQNTPIGMAN